MNVIKFSRPYFLITAFIFQISLFASADTHGSQFVLTVTNGSDMPLSGGVIYTVNGEGGTTDIGTVPSAGFVKLCQMGDPSLKSTELKNNPRVKWVSLTPGMVMPGKSISVDFEINDFDSESVHFEAMYGKSKELCSTINVGIRNIRFLISSPQEEIFGTDKVLSAGAATEPVIKGDLNQVCKDAPMAVDCLRALTMTRLADSRIHYFAGYLPSVLTFLENKYGAEDTLTLLVPHSGAVAYSIKRK